MRWKAPSPSLGRRIVASVALGLGLILLLFGLLVVWSTQESMDAAFRQQVTFAQTLATHVDDVFRYALDTLDHDAASLSLEQGQPLTDAQRTNLADLRARAGIFTDLSVLGPDGAIVWTDPGAEGTSIPCAREALPAGGARISEASTGSASRVLCLSAPIRSRDGQSYGTLVAEVDPTNPAVSLVPSGNSGGMVVQLVTASGQLLAGQSPIGPRGPAEHLVLLADLIATRTPGYRIHAPGPGENFPPHVVAYAPMSSVPSWGIFTEEARDLVVTAPQQLEQRLAFFGLAALLVAVVVAWLDVKQVVRPLEQLTKTAERFASGRLDEPVGLTRDDEVGVLARSFETMRQRLRASMDEIEEWNRELEHRVDERTAEVQRRNEELAQLNVVAEHLNRDLQVREREREELLQRVMNAQEEERQRLAQELHDGTSQALASLQLGLERLGSAVREQGAARDLAAELQVIAGQTLSDVHRLAVELRPSVLDDIGLVAAIDRYLHQECEERWGLEVDFATLHMEQFRLAPSAEVAIYRIVQATLSNALRHAQARRVGVLLERRGEKLVVVVEDDGKGWDPAAVRAMPLEHRLGLAGMEERASAIGATLTIEAAPGNGTTIFLEVPLASNNGKEEADAEPARRAG